MIISEARSHNNFTIIRLVLACVVFVAHYQMLSGSHNPYANVAVDGFFVVSGYLITSSFDSDPDLGRFFVRRFFRLYPLYFTIVLLQALAMGFLVATRLHAMWHEVLSYLVANALFLNFLHPEIGDVVSSLHSHAINPSLWTLKVEVGFYLTLPFLWVLVRRYGDRVMLAIFCLSALYNFLLIHANAPVLARQLPGQLQFFVLGMALYKYRNSLPANSTLSRIAWGVATAVALAFVTTAIRVPVIYPLAMAVAIFGTSCRVPSLNLRLDISYGVYLFHGPIIQFSLLLGWFSYTMFGFAATAVVLLTSALLAERLVERPFIALGKRLTLVVGPLRRGLAGA
jgi:peptidoglycan/LPS O-acetylase OafA/YrhL